MNLVAALDVHKDVWIRLSSDGIALSFAWKQGSPSVWIGRVLI